MPTLNELLTNQKPNSLHVYVASQIGIAQSDTPDENGKYETHYAHTTNLYVVDSREIAEQMACNDAINTFPKEQGWRVCSIRVNRLSSAVMQDLFNYWQANLISKSDNTETGNQIECYSTVDKIFKSIQLDTVA